MFSLLSSIVCQTPTILFVLLGFVKYAKFFQVEYYIELYGNYIVLYNLPPYFLLA